MKKTKLPLNLQFFADEAEQEEQQEQPEEQQQEEQQEQEQQEERKFTQEELNQAVAKRVKRERGKWEKEVAEAKKEAQRLAELTEEERAEELNRLKDEKITKLEAIIHRMNLESDTVDRLAIEGLPIEFKTFLMQDDAETTNTNIKAFKEVFLKAVQEEVDKRLKGKTPSSGGNAKKVYNPWLSETLNLTEQGRILREDPELARKLMNEAN